MHNIQFIHVLTALNPKQSKNNLMYGWMGEHISDITSTKPLTIEWIDDDND